MSEQQSEQTVSVGVQAPVQASSSVQRSQNYTSARLAYDTLIASTKSFSHHFNNLTEAERAEFKSLANHVKTLQKCNQAVSSVNQSRPVAPRRAPRTQPAQTTEGEQVQAQTEGQAQAEGQTSTPAPVARSKRSSRAKDTSPTAEVVAEVQAQSQTPAPVQEQTQAHTVEGEQAQTPAPAPAKTQSRSKSQVKK